MFERSFRSISLAWLLCMVPSGCRSREQAPDPDEYLPQATSDSSRPDAGPNSGAISGRVYRAGRHQLLTQHYQVVHDYAIYAYAADHQGDSAPDHSLKVHAPDGAYNLGGLAHGRYWLLVRTADGQVGAWRDGGGFRGDGPGERALADGEAWRGRDIQVSATRWLRGRVVDSQTGAPLPHAWLVLDQQAVLPGGDRVIIKEPVILPGYTRAGADGSFELATAGQSMPAVTVSVPGYVRAAVPFAIPPVSPDAGTDAPTLSFEHWPEVVTLRLLRRETPEETSEEAKHRPLRLRCLDDEATAGCYIDPPNDDGKRPHGLRENDRLHDVDGVDVRQLGPEAAFELMRRRRGHVVSLSVKNDEEAAPRKVSWSWPAARSPSSKPSKPPT